MRDPRRLLESDASERERQLLSAGAAEEPSPDAAARLALALGVGGSALQAASGAQAAASTSRLLGGKLTFKSLLMFGTGAALVATLSVKTPVTPPPTHEAARQQDKAEPAARPSAGPATMAAAPDAPQPTTAHALASQRSIADEVVRLDAARKALATAEPRVALALLAGYTRAHPYGELSPEALRLRVEALVAAGELRAARLSARQFLRAHPASPHAAALRALLPELKDAARSQP